MGLLIYKYEPFWQEVSVKFLIFRWPLRPVVLLLSLYYTFIRRNHHCKWPGFVVKLFLLSLYYLFKLFIYIYYVNVHNYRCIKTHRIPLLVKEWRTFARLIIIYKYRDQKTCTVFDERYRSNGFMCVVYCNFTCIWKIVLEKI